MTQIETSAALAQELGDIMVCFGTSVLNPSTNFRWLGTSSPIYSEKSDGGNRTTLPPTRPSNFLDQLLKEQTKARREYGIDFRSSPTATAQLMKDHPDEFPVHDLTSSLLDSLGLDMQLLSLMATIRRVRNSEAHQRPKVEEFEAIAKDYAVEIGFWEGGGKHHQGSLMKLASIAKKLVEGPHAE
ncbi:hypothetical protein ABW21_db0208874 [Orbilia brochopaga]|nr:hypothetical protein ABW21_db0208874 [Drechslerella brochopaga]